MKKQDGNAEFSKKEAQERFEAALRGGLKTSPKPLKEKPKLRAPLRAPAEKPTRKP
jgi:hypothetical protein